MTTELPTLATFTARLAQADSRASAGAVAALATGLAADLVAQVAERSFDWEERLGVVAQADALRERAAGQGADVATVYARLVAALDSAVGLGSSSSQSKALGEQLGQAADLLVAICETACAGDRRAAAAGGRGCSTPRPAGRPVDSGGAKDLRSTLRTRGLMDDTTGWVSAAAAMRTAQPANPVPAALTVEERARRVDAALVRRCRRGEQQAWVELVDRFSSYVYALAGRFVRGEDRVQDVYQEVFMRVYTRLDSLEDEHALKPWIAQLARR